MRHSADFRLCSAPLWRSDPIRSESPGSEGGKVCGTVASSIYSGKKASCRQRELSRNLGERVVLSGDHAIYGSEDARLLLIQRVADLFERTRRRLAPRTFSPLDWNNSDCFRRSLFRSDIYRSAECDSSFTLCVSFIADRSFRLRRFFFFCRVV